MKRRNKKKGVPMPRWTETQIKILRYYYRTVNNSLIASLVGRSAKSVVTMASRLGLKKSKARLVEMGRQNVAKRWGSSECA